MVLTWHLRDCAKTNSHKHRAFERAWGLFERTGHRENGRVFYANDNLDGK